MPPATPELIAAVGHPLRRRILRVYLDGSAADVSAGELALAVDEKVGQVAYHLKTLVKCGILRPVRRGEKQAGEGADHGWALDVEADWLRLVLEVWAESGASR
jgi:DNA-binding transcriptional ArsR family regulator